MQGIRQLTAFLVSDLDRRNKDLLDQTRNGAELIQTFISRWCADQFRHFVLLLKFTHVDTNEAARLVLLAVQILGYLLGQFCFAHTR